MEVCLDIFQFEEGVELLLRKLSMFQIFHIKNSQPRSYGSRYKWSEWTNQYTMACRSESIELNAGKTNDNNNIEKVLGKFSSPFGVMDTGATHHLTGRYDILSDVRDMSPILVIMADGHEWVSVKEGSVRLGSKLILESVFYVEE